MLERFSSCYEFPGFSLTRIAGLMAAQLDRLRRRAVEFDTRGAGLAPSDLGDLFLEVKALLAVAAPILIDTAEAARQAPGARGARDGDLDGSLVLTAFDVPEIRPFTIPLLRGLADSVTTGTSGARARLAPSPPEPDR